MEKCAESSLASRITNSRLPKSRLRGRSPSRMNVVVTWRALIDLIEPHLPKRSKIGCRLPDPQATMRVHVLQQGYSLSDPEMEERLIEGPTMRRFACFELISSKISDETTILNLLKMKDLREQILESFKAHLSARAIMMRQSTITDATLITEPCSSKYKELTRVP